MNKPKIIALIPAFNEQNNIAHVIKEVQSLENVDVLVIDDGSSDQTALVAKKAGACVLSLPFNLGIGGAVQAGYQYARSCGYDIAVQVDGDGQHDVKFLPPLIAPILAQEKDLVIGSRFLPPFLGYQSSLVRRLGIRFFSRLISFLTRSKITDPTSGFRACNQKLIHLFADDYPLDFPEPEAIVEAKKAHARVGEVAVEMRARATGQSSIRYLKTGYYMIKVTFAILLRSIQYQQKKRN
jgi:glycosyltransferase involved in cell wall biosynthesis